VTSAEASNLRIRDVLLFILGILSLSTRGGVSYHLPTAEVALEQGEAGIVRRHHTAPAAEDEPVHHRVKVGVGIMVGVGNWADTLNRDLLNIGRAENHHLRRHTEHGRVHR